MTLSHSCLAGFELLCLVLQGEEWTGISENQTFTNFIFSCAFLAGVSAKYILLISPAIKEYLEDTSIGFAWTVKLVAVALMCKCVFTPEKGATLMSVNNVHHDTFTIYFQHFQRLLT